MYQNLKFQQHQLQELKNLKKGGGDITPPAVRRYRIAKAGQDLGEFALPQLKLMVRNGELTMEDCFWDEEANSWLELTCLDDIRP